ncbi:hypothetical protein ABZT04_26375 [Streptomyces sp. NPDC005492]|uniref:hypothetical protein n=1 Tax=Streptomyces sp. NPDC005492 TaxID=3156883 RepID=UPI0033A2A2FE
MKYALTTPRATSLVLAGAIGRLGITGEPTMGPTERDGQALRRPQRQPVTSSASVDDVGHRSAPGLAGAFLGMDAAVFLARSLSQARLLRTGRGLSHRPACRRFAPGLRRGGGLRT